MFNIFKLLLVLLCAALCIGSCSNQVLVVENCYISAKTLASEFVETPDPRKYQAKTGQLLTIWWKLPHEYACAQGLTLQVRFRFCNQEEECLDLDLCRFRGSYTYELTDDAYWCTGGIQSYQIRLYHNDELIEAADHSMWAERIVFDPCDDRCVIDDDDDDDWEGCGVPL